MIRVLVVDDEQLAREGLIRRLQEHPDIEIVGEARDGLEAVELILRLRPTLVFLDIQMPGLDGFEVLERIPAEQTPRIVFVTAHDAHALKAFEVHALDYLLKPFLAERFAACLERARRVQDDERVQELLDRLRQERGDGYPAHFAVRQRDRIVFVQVQFLEAVVGAGNYVELIEKKRKHLLRMTMNEVEGRLDPKVFRRIHRSAIVNLTMVRELELGTHGDGEVVMQSGSRYRMSRQHRKDFVPLNEQ